MRTRLKPLPCTLWWWHLWYNSLFLFSLRACAFFLCCLFDFSGSPKPAENQLYQKWMVSAGLIPPTGSCKGRPVLAGKFQCEEGDEDTWLCVWRDAVGSLGITELLNWLLWIVSSYCLNSAYRNPKVLYVRSQRVTLDVLKLRRSWAHEWRCRSSWPICLSGPVLPSSCIFPNSLLWKLRTDETRECKNSELNIVPKLFTYFNQQESHWCNIRLVSMLKANQELECTYMARQQISLSPYNPLNHKSMSACLNGRRHLFSLPLSFTPPLPGSLAFFFK